jgi:hypothetical protein
MSTNAKTISGHTGCTCMRPQRDAFSHVIQTAEGGPVERLNPGLLFSTLCEATWTAPRPPSCLFLAFGSRVMCTHMRPQEQAFHATVSRMPHFLHQSTRTKTPRKVSMTPTPLPSVTQILSPLKDILQHLALLVKASSTFFCACYVSPGIHRRKRVAGLREEIVLISARSRLVPE